MASGWAQQHEVEALAALAFARQHDDLPPVTIADTTEVSGMTQASLQRGISTVAKPVWWADLLKQHTQNLGYQVPSLQTPVECISACTGSFAEGAVFKDCSVVFRFQSFSTSTLRIFGILLFRKCRFRILRLRLLGVSCVCWLAVHFHNL